MMTTPPLPIQKVISVKNVGRLTNLSASGDVTFRRITLVYGQNGNGKTTLTAILRSLRDGLSAPIDERATLGVQSSPEVKLLLDDGPCSFTSGAWERSRSEIEIFDSAFVTENVYTGDRIDPEHRKNLYQVVVGAQ